MTQPTWFVRFAGRRSGPFGTERLRTMARRGELTRVHSVSADGRTWSPASSLRAVFNEDGTIATDAPPPLAVAEDGEEGMPAGFEELPDSGPLELPNVSVRARLGTARVRPVVVAALVLATVVLALPTSRDDSGALAWWWSEGPLSVAVRGLAVLATALGWVVAFLPPEPARAVSVAGVAATLSATSAASLLGWSPSASLLAPIVPLSAILVALDAAGASSGRLAGRFFSATAVVLGLGAIVATFLRPSPWNISAAIVGACGACVLAWAGLQVGGPGPSSGSRPFWGGVGAASGAMAALFLAAIGGLGGDAPMRAAEASVAACLVLSFATVSWASVHETVETVHALPKPDAVPAGVGESGPEHGP